MKRISMIAVYAAGIIAFTVTILLAQPDQININNKKAFNPKQRSAVIFPHGLHMEGDMSCTDCHHQYVKGKNVLDEDTLEEGNSDIKCSNCHIMNGSSKYNLMEAYHKQCMGCHGKLKKKGQKSGPGLCGKCHPRK